MIEIIRKKALTEEIDYNYLISCLSQYKNPRDKITRLLKSKALIRIKKGLYVFGPDYAKRPFSKEILANLIYGPSYISLEYALSYYGMTPERVEIVTSITNKRNKLFKTVVGNFSYTYLNNEKYYLGITQIKLDEASKILIATKEKALSDKVRLTKGIDTENLMLEYLRKDLRIDESMLRTLNLGKLKKIRNIYKNKAVNLLFDAVKYIKEKS